MDEGVATSCFVGPAFSNHSDYLRGYSAHVCIPCAWMYAFPKMTHRNLIAVPGRLWWPMIGHDSATLERPQWLSVLRDIVRMPLEIPVAGVLTSDPKPRVWPRAEVCTVGSFGLYVHCPDYDLSRFLRLNLARLLDIASIIVMAIADGWPKKFILHGLYADMKRVRKDPSGTVRLEAELQLLRALPEFLPALLTAGIPKHE